MQAEDDILSLLEAKSAQSAREAHRAVILQPGALGDCILTLPLVRLVKEALNLGGVDLIGHAEYVGILPGRSCVDGVRSIDSVDLHRLFAEPMRFDLADQDPLIHLFSGYSCIITFLGEPGSDFEQNLIFTTNCSHSADVVSLPLKPPDGARQHIAEIYTEQFVRQSGLPLEKARVDPKAVQIRVDQADRDLGVELLEQVGIDLSKRLVVIQPGSGGQKKCWRLENFLNVARTLRGPEIEVLFLLGPAEVERLRPSEKVHIHGVTRCVAHLSLPQVVGLLSCADAFVGNDSGVTHLAAGIGLRTIAMFGPTDPTVYRPLGPRVTVVQGQAEGFAEKASPELQKTVLDNLAF
ncbi:MAG TPA: glycosyltransferase family 9 protein [Sedimentisphaerales bacterium]|nr:glycosyltransferase family 9 protein [Sedimentisphaerales bacterium]